MFGLNPQPHLLILLLVLGLLSQSIQSLRFEVKSGEAKCISEYIRKNFMTWGSYNITNPIEGQPLPESHKITVRVETPDRKFVHFGDHVQSGQFSFQTAEDGLYVACFWGADHHPQITLSIGFDWKTVVAAKDWSHVAKRMNVDAMTSSVMNLLETVSSIHAEMSYLRHQEYENQEFSWATNTRMFWLSLLSLLVCFSVAGLQLWHLKNFFEKKKII